MSATKKRRNYSPLLKMAGEHPAFQPATNPAARAAADRILADHQASLSAAARCCCSPDSCECPELITPEAF